MNLENIQKLALEWQEEKQKEVQRKIQADAVSQDASVKINMIDGGLQFAEVLAKTLQQQPAGLDIGTKGTSKRTKR